MAAFFRLRIVRDMGTALIVVFGVGSIAMLLAHVSPIDGFSALTQAVKDTCASRATFVALDGQAPGAESVRVDSTAIGIVGKLQRTPPQRLAQLQRTATWLAVGPVP